jgi:hypothetical protein
MCGKFKESMDSYVEARRAWKDLSFSQWAALAAASRNALGDSELLRYWDEEKKGRAEDSPPWAFASFFKEQPGKDGAIRINCGGERLTTLDGRVFEHDRCYLGGRLWITAHEPLDPLLQDARWATSKEEQFEYAIPVIAGRYGVVLQFAEIVDFCKEPGARVFDVFVEGKKVLESYDLAKEAGYRTRVLKNFEVEVPDGLLEIQLRGTIGGPILSAIEVLPVQEGR